MILNTHTPNKTASEYIRQMLMEWKEEINKFTIIVGNFKKLHSELSLILRVLTLKFLQAISL